jgi:hypothetical protein
VRRIGLTAAGLLATLALALALVANGRARPSLVHTCSAADRQFIEVARTNMTALELWADEYQSGEATAADVTAQVRAATRLVRGTGPTDYSLQQTRRLLVGMLTEYARAVQIQERHGDAGPHVYRAYGLANYAHDALVRVQGPLSQLGCDLRPLL